MGRILIVDDEPDMHKVERLRGKLGAVRIQLEDLDVRKASLCDERPRTRELLCIQIDAHDSARLAHALAERPENAHCAAAKVDALGVGDDPDPVEHRLHLGLPHARLEPQPLELGGPSGQQVFSSAGTHSMLPSAS